MLIELWAISLCYGYHISLRVVFFYRIHNTILIYKYPPLKLHNNNFTESGRKSQRSSPNRTYNSAGGSLSLISPDTADEDHPPLALVDTPGSADRAGLDRDLPSPLGHGLSLANPGAGLVIEDDLAMEDLSLFATMVHLRCLLVQLSSGVRLEDLVEVLQQSLPSIASIAGGNISDTAGGVISSVGAKCARSAAGAFGLLKVRN